MRLVRFLAAMALMGGLLTAQASTALSQDQTLADIRQELTVLYVEVQRLKRELSTTGAAAGTGGASSPLERLDLIEAELGRLNGLTERLQNRIDRIVADGTNRIGDLEFRLVELEGGDLSALGETTTLGGPVPENELVVAAPAPRDGTPELAVGEQVDFDAAMAALDAGNYQEAAVKFAVFTETYTVGPLTGEAHFFRGKALAELGDTANAARAFLESFSGAPNNPRAPEALLNLGLALGKLGQINEACISLEQVSVRYPGASVTAEAAQAASQLGCG